MIGGTETDRIGGVFDSLAAFYKGRRVLVTGHTGFKGAWLTEWLLAFGAEVAGLSLPPYTTPSLFDHLDLAGRMNHRIGDIRKPGVVSDVVRDVRPSVVFHLAAQAIVRESYDSPLETYATNVMGTIHILEALRQLREPCAAVFITSDKCYENREWIYGYRETDPMGGHDPYSSSKGCAELAIASFRRSFFPPAVADAPPVAIASARAGNVIGGGDWGTDRIVPDCMRALSRGEAIVVRNKHARRPWQHVLEPLCGYLMLAAALYKTLSEEKPAFGNAEPLFSAFNFGPARCSTCSVRELVEEILLHWPGTWEDRSDASAAHEAHWLALSTEKAHHLLGWQPVWNFKEAVARTVDWYRRCRDEDPGTVTREQIAAYTGDAVAARRRGTTTHE